MVVGNCTNLDSRSDNACSSYCLRFGVILRREMKLEYTEGCVCYGLDVDGEPFNDLDEAKKREVFNRMVEAILKDYDIQNITIDLLHDYGEYKHIGHCDECGDNISSFTLEI